MKPILTVGVTCVDFVQFLPTYPKEDSDQRCLDQSWERGGNASNNASVLASLGSRVEFLGTIGNDNLKDFLLKDMDSYGIKNDNCPVVDCVTNSVSGVICAMDTGSRTIVHSRGTLPEFTHEEFKVVNLSNYSWIHFEGRNENQVENMLGDIQAYNDLFPGNDALPNYRRKKLPISIEVEKRIETISKLLPYADVAFVGKDFAMMKGATDPATAAKIGADLVTKGTLVICPWGDQGAAFTVAGYPSANVTAVEAYPPEKIIDSLGAGDTFNAAVIHALTNGGSIEDSVRFGCKIAGGKLGFRGFRQIAQLSPFTTN